MLATRRRFFKIFSSLVLAATTLVACAGDKAKPAAEAAKAAQENPKVSIKTNMGEIVVELYPEKTPKTVANFLMYVKSGYYSGTIFHRVIDNFMIQGGGFDKDLNPKPAMSKVENEAKSGLKNEAYTIAMARTNDPHSASSQFFINVKDNDFLNYPGRDGWGYCVFGKVVKGKDIVDKIKSVPVAMVNAAHQNVPIGNVIIESATVVK
ncbi:MAG: peptidyl-prolyl cis-trans isomerase [Burkholderiales bacterium]|nr:peptidyl-prolyl cis-trans isomerase [Burkholderiales bacterium]